MRSWWLEMWYDAWMIARNTQLVRIWCAAECDLCESCGEPVCPNCVVHYADCECPGPSNFEELGYELVEISGVLYGRLK